jgi:23S rRNA (uracil1939-C5)-methyltransferase
VASVPEQHRRVLIDQVVAGGDGLAREASGRVVFVPGVLPGEEVTVRLVTAKRDFARGDVVEVVSPSPLRVDPPCPTRRLGCGGCAWQHADPAAQLSLKTEVVRDALRRTARMPEVEVVPQGSVPPWAYRTSMRVAVDRHGVPSLRRLRSNDPVPLGHCMVAHPLLDELLHTARFVGAEDVSLRIADATGERSAWWTRAHPGDEVRVDGLPTDVRVGPDAHVHETVAGHRFRVSAEAFFQSGPAAAELLVQAVRELGGAELADARHVVDAYGGVGLFAATVVPSAAAVTLVEGSAVACEDAEVNLVGRAGAVQVVCAPLERWSGDPGRPVDVVIADPSRQGLGPAAAAVLVDLKAPVLVLVGCDPVAFARDAALLASAGYRLTQCRTLDLFPQTHHVETVGRFEFDHDLDGGRDTVERTKHDS